MGKIPVHGDLEVNGRVKITVAPSSPEDAVRLAEIENVVRFYRHIQSNPADVWEITHNFNTTDVSWYVIPDSSDVTYSVTVLDENTVQVIFDQPITGIAYIFNTRQMGETTSSTVDETLIISIAGENLQQGDVVYLNPDDNKIYKLVSDVNTNLIGILLDPAVTAGGLAHVMLKGLYSSEAPIFTPDTTYYYDITQSTFTTEPKEVFIGTAKSTKILHVDFKWVSRVPQEIYVSINNLNSQIGNLSTQVSQIQPPVLQGYVLLGAYDLNVWHYASSRDQDVKNFTLPFAPANLMIVNILWGWVEGGWLPSDHVIAKLFIDVPGHARVTHLVITGWEAGGDWNDIHFKINTFVVNTNSQPVQLTLVRTAGHMTARCLCFAFAQPK